MEIDNLKKQVLEDVDPVLKKKKKRRQRRNRILITLQFLAVIAIIAGVFYSFIGISTVDGNSMYPTLHDHNIVLYTRHNKEYKSGDIVALNRPNGEVYVKRIIAVSGDTVNVQRGKVYVNGQEIVTEQAVGVTEAKSDTIKYPLTVGDKEVFVLGDNREISRDSREFGTVKVKAIKGTIRWYMGEF